VQVCKPIDIAYGIAGAELACVLYQEEYRPSLVMVSRPQMGSPKTLNLFPIDRRRLSRRRAVSSEF